MTQRTWSTTEVSAYLDGQLETKRQAALETDMEHNLALRQRVEEMQRVVALTRAEPLRQPPRNYLLTEAMVAEAMPQTARASGRDSRRRMPLLGMRLATAMVTLAFVVTFGLTVLRGTMMPTMRMGASEAPDAALLARGQEDELRDSQLAEVEELPDEPVMMMAPEEERAEAEALARDSGDSYEEEVTVSVVPEAALAEGETLPEEPSAVGGESGVPEPEISAMQQEEPVTEEALPSEEASEEPPTASSAERLLPESETTTLQAQPEPAGDKTAESAHDEEIAEAPLPGDETPTDRSDSDAVAQEGGNGIHLTWISTGLGIAALLLAAITLWLTYQPLSRHN